MLWHYAYAIKNTIRSVCVTEKAPAANSHNQLITKTEQIVRMKLIITFDYYDDVLKLEINLIINTYQWTLCFCHKMEKCLSIFSTHPPRIFFLMRRDSSYFQSSRSINQQLFMTKFFKIPSKYSAKKKKNFLIS